MEWLPLETAVRYRKEQQGPDRLHEVGWYQRASANYKTLKQDDAVYKFATKCGSWDWTGILIMIVCGRPVEWV